MLLTRPSALEPEGFEGFYETFEKPAEWGELHQWEVLAAGYRRDADGTEIITFAIFYTDPDAAEAAKSPEQRSMEAAAAEGGETFAQAVHGKADADAARAAGGTLVKHTGAEEESAAADFDPGYRPDCACLPAYHQQRRTHELHLHIIIRLD